MSPFDKLPIRPLRILTCSRMKARLVGASPISNQQTGKFDSQ
jgi:hypothetical protein